MDAVDAASLGGSLDEITAGHMDETTKRKHADNKNYDIDCMALKYLPSVTSDAAGQTVIAPSVILATDVRHLE